MKVFIPAVILLATLCGTWAQTNDRRSNGLNLLDALTWGVASQSEDHITYVRKTADQEVDLKKLLNIDCNDTTTTPQPETTTLNAQRSLSAQRSRGNGWRAQSQRGNLELRSGDAEGLRRRGSKKTTASAGDSSAATGTASSASGLDSTRGQTTFEGGDANWVVTHKDDDHITYTRKNATLSQDQRVGGIAGQGQDQEDGLQQGKLTQIGSGSDSVLVRVVNQNEQNEELTEEGLLAGRGQQRLRSGTTGTANGGYPTSELVHPYVKRVNKTLKALRSGSAAGANGSGSRREGLKSLNRSGVRSGRRNGLRGESPAALHEITTTAIPTTAAPKEDDYPPRVGDEVNGWRVVAKNKDSISWERVGSTSSSSSSSTAGATAAGLQLKSLGSQSGSASSSRSRGLNVRSRTDRLQAEDQESSALRDSNAQRQLIPSAEGELVEGFPRVFNTYSRSLFGNESDIDSVGTIRTSLTNTTNWIIGDELAGWRVIGKDYRGIIWEKITNNTATFERGTGGVGAEGLVDESEYDEYDNILTEEDLLGDFNKALKSGAGGGLDDESDEDGSGLEYKVPPGTWYLAKETKNKVTWQRDGVPATLVFDKEAYPRVGDVDSVGQWKVESKTKEQITWVRINSLKDDSSSSEEKAN